MDTGAVMVDKVQNAKTETSRLFYHISSLIYQAGANVVRLPSAREIAADFQVSRALVQRVIDQFIQAGSLESRQGSGTYTVPNTFTVFGFGSQPPMVGLISGSGQPLFFERTLWRHISDTGNALTRRNFMVRYLQNESQDKSELIKIVAGNRVNGLVGLYVIAPVQPVLQAAAELGIPVVSYGYHCPGVNSVVPDCEQNGYDVGRRFLAEGRRRLFFGISLDRTEEHLAGFRRAYGDAGVEFDESLVFGDPATFLEDVRRKIEAGIRPDAFFLVHYNPSPVIALLREYGIDIAERCRLFLFEEEFLYDCPEFRGLVRNNDYLEGAEIAAAMIERMLAGEFTVESIKIPVYCREIKQ